MIEPGELHRYFMVRHIATGREAWILGQDTRYSLIGPGLWDYRADRDGEYFLARSMVHTHPWGLPLRLDQVEPLPDGRGLWHPDSWEHWGWLCRNYEGSWRQSAGVPIEHRNLSTDGWMCHSCGATVAATALF
jgi:hypothetical protein